jgi:CRP-like cAMP-binding protein
MRTGGIILDHFTATPVMLRSIPFFGALTEAQLSGLCPQLHLKNCRPGGPIREDQENAIYFVHQGVVAVYTLTRNGSRKILFFQGPGQLLSHSAMGGKPPMLFLEAMEPSILLSMDRDGFSQAVSQMPQLSEALLHHYETILWRMGHQLKNTAGYLPMERKIAIKLRKLVLEFGIPDSSGSRIRFPLTVTQLADFVGAPRETVSRALKKLSDWDLILRRGRYFTVPDIPRLTDYCQYGSLEDR